MYAKVRRTTQNQAESRIVQHIRESAFCNGGRSGRLPLVHNRSRIENVTYRNMIHQVPAKGIRKADERVTRAYQPALFLKTPQNIAVYSKHCWLAAVKPLPQVS